MMRQGVHTGKRVLLALLCLAVLVVPIGCKKPAGGTYTVSYDCQGGRPKVSDTYTVGELFSPMPPSATAALTGYTFTGWYYDRECTKPYDYNDPQIFGDVTLYAGWTNLHDVRFYTDTDQRIEPRTVAYGTVVAANELPEPEPKTIGGTTYAFDYWLNLNTGERVGEDGLTMAGADVNLFAVYKTGLSRSFDLSRRGEWVARSDNALTWAQEKTLQGHGSIEVSMTLMPGAGWAGIAFQMSDAAKDYQLPFSQGDVSHYAFVILASPSGATQIVRRDAGAYQSCSTGWGVTGTPLKDTAYAERWAAYVAGEDSITLHMKVEIVSDEQGNGRVNGYIYDDAAKAWELVCFATEDGKNSVGVPNTTPVKYVPRDYGTVGVISQKSGVRFSDFAVTPAAS